MGLYVFFQRIVDRVSTLQTIRYNFTHYTKCIYVNHIEMIKFCPKFGFKISNVYLYDLYKIIKISQTVL